MYCENCQRNVDPSSRHCRRCEQCVLGFDHHCKWVNTCIGQLNYKPFILLLISFIALMLAYLASALRAALLPEAVLWASVLLWVVALPVAIAALSVLTLLTFHGYLALRGITTYQHIVQLKAQDL